LIRERFTEYLGQVIAHLFVKVPRPGDSKGTFTFSVFESNYHLLDYLFNRSEVETIPLSALSKNTTSELASYLHTIISL